MKSLALALALVATPAVAADRFNLVCVGTETDPRDSVTPFKAEFRFDLVSKTYCQDECDGPSPIKAVSATRIVLQDLDDPQLGFQVEDISRETGKYHAYTKVGLARFVTDATCEAAPFKAIPRKAIKRRF
jgi:hypothetical protein